MDPLTKRLERPGAVILDGGLATELEAAGYDLNHELWSARVLVDEPDAIGNVHADYARAGAEVLTTATYQLSFDALAAAGVDEAATRELFVCAVSLARVAGEKSTIVAVSLGSRGACRADGSEFTGDYDAEATDEALRAFHGPRLDAALAADGDVIAFETIPRLDEAVFAATLLEERGARGWISVSCRDGRTLSHGEPIEELAAALNDFTSVVAVGINCTAPRHVEELVRRVSGATSKPIAVYPNSGETWVSGSAWVGERDPGDFCEMARGWVAAGARLVGGCCRTRPEHVRSLARTLG